MHLQLSLRRRLCSVFCGGFCGTLARYWLSQLVQQALGKGWPYDILLINLTGAFLLALITTLADAALWIGPTRRLFLGVGFLGAYTTFSSLVLGDLQLFQAGNAFPSLTYLLLSWLVGLLAVFSGTVLGRWLIAWKLTPALAKSPLSSATAMESEPALPDVSETLSSSPSSGEDEYDLRSSH